MQVIGLDFSHAFVAACDKMKADARATVPISIQGDIRSTVSVALPSDCLPHVSKTRFVQGDACDLPDLGLFDCVLAANLLCRLPNPAAFLARLPRIIKKVRTLLLNPSFSQPCFSFSSCPKPFIHALAQGGVFVLVSPYSWLEEYTPKANWLGGVVNNGSIAYSAACIANILSADFEMLSQSDMPFLIREHARKFQWGCSHAVVWRRK